MNQPWYIFAVIFLLFTACSQPPPPTAKRTGRKPTAHFVKTASVSPQPLTTTAVYTGTLRARHLVRIFTQEQGSIIRLPYYEGDAVKANALLVQLDDALLKAELNKAVATHKYARINARRLQKLAKKRLVSADELSRAQTEQAIARAEEQILRIRLSYTKITAPFTGIVTARLAEPGDVISENSHVLTIIKPSSLVIDVEVSEWLLSQLKLRDSVEVRIDALGTKTFKGTISRIHPTIEPRTRLGRIEVSLRPLPKGIREGQFCRVTIKSHRSMRLTLPYTALRRDRDGEYVFLVDANNKTQRQTVRSGQRLADSVEILEGLKTGQVVVIKGFLGLQARKTVQTVD
jgi:RND family efflux transporter MFP subunit